MKRKPKKVLIIGWDGAPFELIKDLIKGNRLPNLKRIINNGFFGPLETVPYVMSSCAWSTMVTGKNAGKHGIFDFYSNEFEDHSYFRRPINASARQERELWDLLSEHRIKVGAVNVPMTYPAVKVNGFMVAGLLSPSINDKNFVYPHNLLNNYQESKNYTIDFEGEKNTPKDQFIESIDKMIEARTSLTLYLIEENKDVDVLFTVFTAPDRFAHYFWHFYDKTHPYRKNESKEDLEKYEDTLIRIYEKLDEKLGIIVRKFEKEMISKDFSIILISDHGISSLKKILHLNKFLNEKGYLKFKPKEERKELGKDILDKNVSYIFGKVDWSNTKAYAMGKRGAIHVNLEGREPNGIVNRGDYRRLVEKLKSDLKSIKDPETSETIVKKVYSRDELFFGKNIQKAPDILIFLKEGYFPFGYAFSLDKPGLISVNDKVELPFVTGIESGDGILCIRDKNIKTNATFKNSKISDFTPTLLYLLGLHIPKDMDGRVLEEIFKKSYLQKNPIRYEEPREKTRKKKQVYSEEDAEKIRKRLEKLGYT